MEDDGGVARSGRARAPRICPILSLEWRCRRNRSNLAKLGACGADLGKGQLFMSTETARPVQRQPANAPPSFHLLAKPSGSTCNIDCAYCFFLSKEALYPNDKHRMSEATLESYIRQLLESHRTPEVTVAWQGGEPTLMKLEFFEKAVALVEKYRKPGQTVQQTFQTNGLLIDDAWCAFFKKHNLLVGLSVDGPRELHDAYRRDRRGQGTFDLVMRGWRFLKPTASNSTSSAPSTRLTKSTAAECTDISGTSLARNGCSSSRSSSGRR